MKREEEVRRVGCRLEGGRKGKDEKVLLELSVSDKFVVWIKEDFE